MTSRRRSAQVRGVRRRETIFGKSALRARSPRRQVFRSSEVVLIRRDARRCGRSRNGASRTRDRSGTSEEIKGIRASSRKDEDEELTRYRVRSQEGKKEDARKASATRGAENARWPSEARGPGTVTAGYRRVPGGRPICPDHNGARRPESCGIVLCGVYLSSRRF